MKRKLVQAGRSLAVTLPADIVQRFGLEKGMSVDVSFHPSSGALTIRPGARYAGSGQVTTEFEHAVEDLLETRAELHRRLSR